MSRLISARLVPVILAAAAALGLPSLGAGVAQAQSYGSSPPPGPYTPPDPAQYPPPPGYGQPQSPAEIEGNLRTQLRLRPDQGPALHAFVQAIQPPRDLQQRMQQDQMAARTMTTPQRMDLMIANMDEMRRLMVARAAATKQFYAQLTPDQQRRFDSIGEEGGQGMAPDGMGPGPQ